MSGHILDGKLLASQLKERLSEEIHSGLEKFHQRDPAHFQHRGGQ